MVSEESGAIRGVVRRVQAVDVKLAPVARSSSVYPDKGGEAIRVVRQIRRVAQVRNVVVRQCLRLAVFRQQLRGRCHRQEASQIANRKEMLVPETRPCLRRLLKENGNIPLHRHGRGKLVYLESRFEQHVTF